MYLIHTLMESPGNKHFQSLINTKNNQGPKICKVYSEKNKRLQSFLPPAQLSAGQLKSVSHSEIMGMCRVPQISYLKSWRLESHE